MHTITQTAEGWEVGGQTFATRDEAVAYVATMPDTRPEARFYLTHNEQYGWAIFDGGGLLKAHFGEDHAQALDYFGQLYALATTPTETEPAPKMTGKPFTAMLVPEGVESSDGRLLEPDTTTWRDPPQPLMMQDTASHGEGEPGPAWFAGAITEFYRDPAFPGMVMGRGHLLQNEDGARAETLIRGGLRGVSIDGYGLLPPVRQESIIDQYGQPVRLLTRYNDTVLMGASVVPHPAFPQTSIWFDDEPCPQMGDMTPTGMDSPPAVVDLPGRDEPLGILVASGGGPLHPPQAWFDVPEPDEYQPIRITAAGQWTGHVARKGICHVAYATCEQAPSSKTNYAYFHTDAVHTAEGVEVPCGVVTANVPHVRDMGTTREQRATQLEHTGLQVAKVRVTDGKHGVWSCGAIRPGLDDATLWSLQGAKTSGEWFNIRDGGRYYPMELCALIAVNTGGYPIPRAEVLVASATGEVLEQIGNLDGGEEITFTDDCAECDEARAAALAVRQAEVEAELWEIAPTLMLTASGDLGLTLADREMPWDGAAAAASVWAWAKKGDSFDFDKAARAFFWHAPNPQNKGDFKLCFARVVNGDLVAVPKGVFACAAAVQGARSPLKVPSGELPAIKAKIAGYYRRMSTSDEPMTPPWQATVTDDGKISLGGEPSQGTPKDKRLKRNRMSSVEDQVSSTMAGDPEITDLADEATRLAAR